MSGVLNAGAYFQSEGMTFKGLDESGKAIVESRDGLPGTVDMKAFMKQNGIPEDATIEYNDPTTALNESPVGLVDRLSLSFGNEKGKAAYLKNKFDQVAVDESGDMLVKNKGVWQRVDPSGFASGQDSWSVSEMLADAADISKDVIGAVASTVGGALGAGGGLLAGGVGSVPGAIAGAGAGQGLASGASAVLGRFLGTYDASPEEMAKDIALDTVLAMTGEGVAIGAAKSVLPAIKNFVSKGASEMTDASKRVMANFVSKTTGISEPSVLTAFQEAPLVNSFIDSATEAAKLPQSLVNTSNVFNESVGAAIPAGSREAVELASRKQMMTPMRAMVGEPNGADSIQKRFSSKYRGKVSQYVNSVEDTAEWSVAEPIGEALQSLGTQLAEMGALEGAPLASGKFIVKGNKDLVGMNILEANQFRKATQSFLDAASSTLDSGGVFKGKTGARGYLDTLQKLDDSYYELVEAFPQFESVLTPISSKLKQGMINAAPQPTNLIGRTGQAVDGPTGVRNISDWYGERRNVVRTLEKHAKNGVAGMDALISSFNQPVSKGLTGKQLFEVASELMPTQEAGAAAMRSLRGANAAREFLSTLPEGSLMERAARDAAISGSRKLVGAMGGPAVGKQSFEAIKAPTYGLRQLNQMMKTMTAPVRRSIMNDPNKLGALLSTATGEIYEDSQ